MAKENLDDVKILETIKQNHLLPNDETVVLLHRLRYGQNKNMALSDWCTGQKWKFVHYTEIMGSEASVVVLYDLNQQTEMYSRAKNCLIIVQK